MASDITTNVVKINEYLTIWAIAGPVFIAMITAWWNRKNELENREFNKKREDDIEKCRNNNQKTQKEIELRKEEIKEIKNAVVRFVSFAIECNASMVAISVKNIGPNEVSNILEQHSKKTQKLNDAFSELFLLSPPQELTKSVHELLNYITKRSFYEYKNGDAQVIGESVQQLKSKVLQETQQFVKNEQYKILSLVTVD